MVIMPFLLVQASEPSALALPDTQSQLIQVCLALLIVVACIYAVAWLIKRNRAVGGVSGLPMKTLAVLPMGIKEKILLVEVGSKQMLLGMTPSSINTLAVFDEPVITPQEQNTLSFSHRLQQIMAQLKNAKSMTQSRPVYDEENLEYTQKPDTHPEPYQTPM